MIMHQAAFLVHVVFSSVQGKAYASGSALMMQAPEKPKPETSATQIKQPKEQAGKPMTVMHPHPGARQMHGEFHGKKQ